MSRTPGYLIIIFVGLFETVRLINGDTYSVKVGTEQYINVVDKKFLSFTVDPKYLFSSTEKYNSKECICMASSLSPSFIRIAGPSTSHMTFHNTTITINDLDSNESDVESDEKGPKKFRLSDLFSEGHFEFQSPKKRRSNPDESGLSVSHKQWKKFVQWAKSGGFDLVFALNNAEKTSSGMWDPNTALNILTVAEKANVRDMFWQLGYECTNQSIEEYLNDLETLRVIIETFPSGQRREWKVVGGDVTSCLHADSKSDFKDYVMLSSDMMDAVLLNGNSSSRELQRMSDKDRLKLLKTLSRSTTPLWLTETAKRTSDLERAVDWMSSLGYSAKNGFSVHFRELMEDELYEPSLSFYMALLFKNLVGERVLDVDMEAEQAILFAHCTSLRRKPVPGAVTLFGANMDEEPARFSLKLSKREEGGDIMQFVLGHDHSGNIVVNGRAMYYEGDIRPVVKRVRPYKTLLLNLPPKSFGFWVLANTKIEACHDVKDEDVNEKQEVEVIPIDEQNTEGKSYNIKTKRSIYAKSDDEESPDFPDIPDIYYNENKNTERAYSEQFFNKELKTLQKLFQNKLKKRKGDQSIEISNKFKRQIFDQDEENESEVKKLRRPYMRTKIDKNRLLKHESKPKTGLFGKLLKLNTRLNNTRNLRKERARKAQRLSKSKISKRNSKQLKNKPIEGGADLEVQINKDDHTTRRKRSIDKYESTVDVGDSWEDNEIEDIKGDVKLGKILRKIHKQLLDLPIEIHETKDENIENLDENGSETMEDQIEVNTKLLDDKAVINFKEKSNHGLIKSTIEKFLSVLQDLNKNLNKIWNAVDVLK